MPTETGSLSQLLDKLSKTDDPKTIFELSREIKEGSRPVRIRLDDPNAAYYPFTLKKGDKVVSKTGDSIDPESIGEVVDGVYEGTVKPGWYDIVYIVKRDKDGLHYHARDLDLRPVPVGELSR
jgi:hypothetical protein